MIRDYIDEAMKSAKYEILSDDRSFYGEIPQCRGVYANALTLEECRDTLEEVLEEWLLLRIHENLDIPVINDIQIRVRKVA